MTFIIFGAALGAVCSLLGYRAPVLLPLGGLLSVGAVLSGIILHAQLGVIGIEVIGSITVSQFVYLSISLTNHFVRSRTMMMEAQAAIGRELRAKLEVPRSLPSELSGLITQLRHAQRLGV
jgi:hypothetical protein